MTYGTYIKKNLEIIDKLWHYLPEVKENSEEAEKVLDEMRRIKEEIFILRRHAALGSKVKFKTITVTSDLND